MRFQQAMTVSSGALANPLPKYKNAVAVRSVMLEDSLRASGYLASGTPKFHVDAEIIWPTGHVQKLPGLKTGRVVEVNETQ